MMMAQAQLKIASHGSDDGAKRRQIIEGARSVFLQRGFDAASMNDIARGAGVSKGTLYVYFDTKEELFQAIVNEECLLQAETTFRLDPADRDIKGALARVGVGFIEFLCSPAKASAMRTVMAIAERMPEIGKLFYETGPAVGIGKLADYLRAQTEAGLLQVDDFEIAAAQFLDSCKSTLFTPVMFNFRPAPEKDAVEHVVGVAVRTFLRAYGVGTRQ
jgi:AcrR family transcriptional regulator